MIKKARQYSAWVMSAALLCMSGQVIAATGNTTVGFGGTITDEAPPAVCNVVSVPVVDASFAVPTAGAVNYSKTTSFTINCTSGASFSVRAPAMANSLQLGASTMEVQILYGVTNIGSTGSVSFTGTGADQVIPLNLTFTAPGGAGFVYGVHHGSISGTVVLTITY